MTHRRSAEELALKAYKSTLVQTNGGNAMYLRYSPFVGC